MGTLTGRRVLIVEDEYFIAGDLADALAGEGADVVGPVATLEGAKKLLSAPLDFAILDINLRGELSFALADLLAAAGIPFAFATGYDPAIIPERFAQRPRWEKPFELPRLLEALPGLLDGSLG